MKWSTLVTDRRNLEHDEDVGAEIEDFLRNVAVDAVDKGDDGDDGGDSDHHAEQSERGAQFVRPQRQERDLDRLGDVHSAGYGHALMGLSVSPERFAWL